MIVPSPLQQEIMRNYGIFMGISIKLREFL